MTATAFSQRASSVVEFARRGTLIAALAALWPRAVLADVPPEPRAPAAATAAPPTPGAVSPKRVVPDYEGRPGAPASAGEVLLWVPRIVLSPLYFVSEFVIRRPLGAALTAAERANLPATLYDFFAFGPEHKAGFAPIVLVDFGFNPAFGIYLFWDDAFFKGNDLRLHGSTWGVDWLAGSFTERIHLSKRETLTLGVNAVRRPDHVYYGLGPRTLQSAESRYGENLLDVTLGVSDALWRSSRVEAAVGMRTAAYYDGHFGDDPSLSQQVRAGVFQLPPGFGRAYTTQTSRILAALDSRRPYPAEGSGARVEAQATLANNFDERPPSAWLRVDGGAAGYLDVDGYRRVLSLGVEASLANPLGPGPIPFTELVSLGGDAAPMPGLYPGRLVDRSAAAATLRYHWPIGPDLSGSMQVAVGNVFGTNLVGFDPKLLRLSAALGIQSDLSPDADIHLLIGFGSETFDHGGQIDSLRLAFGTSRF